MNRKYRAILQRDVYRYQGKDGLSAFLKALRTPGFRYTYCLRRRQFHAEQKGLLSRIHACFWRSVKRHYSYKYGYQIPSRADIGPGFYLGHYGHVIVSPHASIGANVSIFPGVTIGASNEATQFSRPGAPTIGDRVWIGANAIIVGRVLIGSDTLIAPGAFVSTDAPCGSIVRGNPARVLTGHIGSGAYCERVRPD